MQMMNKITSYNKSCSRLKLCQDDMQARVELHTYGGQVIANSNHHRNFQGSVALLFRIAK